jgi:integrase
VGRRGLGTKRERSKGVWQLRLEVDGKVHTRTVHGSEALADLELATMRVASGNGTLDVVDTSVKVGQLVTRWIEWRAPNLSPTTIAGYRKIISNYLEPAALWKMAASDVRLSHLDSLYAELLSRRTRRGTPLSPTTVRGVHNLISAVYRQAVKWEVVAVSPAKGATPPSARSHKIQPPTVEEIARALDALDGTLRLFVLLSAVLGTRRGETVALQWRDFDLEARTVTVSRAAVEDESGAVLIKGTKTDRIRKLAIDDVTVDALREHLERQTVTATKALTEIAGESFLFSTSATLDRPWRPQHATMMWSRTRMRKQVNLPTVRLHDLRHAMVTRLLAAGVDVRTVAERAGHMNPTMTLRVYAHFVPERDREAAELLGVGLLPAGDGDDG